jgi:uncharacterized protein involved in outer membrane biogenesis
LWLALALLAAILAVLIVPPLVSLGRYKSQITHLMASSLGRPVRLSSVELRLLPRPGFVLTDLSVEDDPAYSAEPILHANTVTASFRLLSLWRGRLEISRISVDEASLNLVRTDAGRWNLDALLNTAAAHAGAKPNSAQQNRPLPYLEATNSRINIKRGVEKLPLSLVSTDLSLWQEEPGDWRVRLRGQPARTDVSLDLADTGFVRLEARVRRVPQLAQIPLHVDVEWKEAQLGQLSRLAIGSDPGWRGDLTGELHLDGTVEAAQVKIRLRATGVHRAEFAPVAPMDFDATCGFVYHYSNRALENLACDSPLGDGRIHLSGDLPGKEGLPRFSVELDRIPVAAGLDALRTVRNGFGPGLEAKGTISGKIVYDPGASATIAAGSSVHEKPNRRAHLSKEGAGEARLSKARPAVPGPLTGSMTVDGFQLSGDGLSAPIHVPKMVLEPAVAAAQDQSPGQSPASALLGTASIPSGGAVPLTITSRLTLSGYQVTLRGQATLARGRELARVAGMADASALDALAGEPVVLDLRADGPWLPPQSIPFSNIPPAVAASNAANLPPVLLTAGTEDVKPIDDSLIGTVTFHNANWKADYLANRVEIAQATLHLDNGKVRWDPVAFSYGPVKGTATLTLPAKCDAGGPCPATPGATFTVQFAELDASALQAAILGAHARGTLLSELIARLRPTTAPAWPQLEGAVKAGSLILGPVTLQDASATVHIVATGAEIAGLDGRLLGGSVHGSGTLRTGDKPVYTLEGQFEKLSPAAVGQLLEQRWSGGTLDGDGKIELSGFTGKDLTASAKGTLHFEWRHGAVGDQKGIPAKLSAASEATALVPPALARFDRWTADAEIANGTITLKQNQVQQGSRKHAVEAAVTLGDPPKVTYTVPKETLAKRR